jgi:hypothetical protein
MKSVSDNLLMLVLAIVLGLSPLQSIAASASNCMKMTQGMHHQMNVSEKVMQNDMAQSDTQHDCCGQTACDMSHCASTIAVAITSDTMNDMTYTVSSVYLKPSVSLIQFYPSSLYRPPKI